MFVSRRVTLPDHIPKLSRRSSIDSSTGFLVEQGGRIDPRCFRYFLDHVLESVCDFCSRGWCYQRLGPGKRIEIQTDNDVAV